MSDCTLQTYRRAQPCEEIRHGGRRSANSCACLKMRLHSVLCGNLINRHSNAGASMTETANLLRVACAITSVGQQLESINPL
jgi:hypothetical protein